MDRVSSPPLPSRSQATDAAVLEVSVQGLTDGAHTIDVLVNGVAVGTIQSVFQDVAKARFTLPPGTLLPRRQQGRPRRPDGQRRSRSSSRSGSPIPASTRSPARCASPRRPGRTWFCRARTPRRACWTSPARSGRHGVAASASSGGDAADGERERGAGSSTPTATRTCSRPPSWPTSPSSWHASEGADLVIIGARELLPSLRPLAEQRAREGLRVAVVDVADVYDEFSAGEKDALAIRSFLSNASRTGPPRRASCCWPARPPTTRAAGSGSPSSTRSRRCSSRPGTSRRRRTTRWSPSIREIGPALADRPAPDVHRCRHGRGGGEDPRAQARGPKDTLLLVRDRDGTIPFSAAVGRGAGLRSRAGTTQDFARGADDSARPTRRSSTRSAPAPRRRLPGPRRGGLLGGPDPRHDGRRRAGRHREERAHRRRDLPQRLLRRHRPRGPRVGAPPDPERAARGAYGRRRP